MSIGNNSYSRDRTACLRQKRYISWTKAQKEALMSGCIVRYCPVCSTSEMKVYHLTKKAGIKRNAKESM